MTNIIIDTSFLSTVGFGGIAGFLIGFMLKNLMKIPAVVAGIFLAVFIYLESQEIMTGEKYGHKCKPQNNTKTYGDICNRICAEFSV
jgi:uncharacterized membrane protein (Fun14 family)